MLIKTGTIGFDAPSNIGLMIIGWLYGEDDFGKSICIANNCGEDTDCTAATLGAVLGIIKGYSNLPEPWVKPLNGIINTCCINHLSGIPIPNTVEELSDRVLRVIPGFLGRDYCDILYGGNGFTLETKESHELPCETSPIYIPLINGLGKPKDLPIHQLLSLSPFAVKYEFTTFYAILDYMEEPYIKLNQPRKIKLTILDNGLTGHQQWVSVKIYTPEGIIIEQGKEFTAPLQNTYLYKIEKEIEIKAEAINHSKVEILVDISIEGRHTNGIIKILLLPTI